MSRRLPLFGRVLGCCLGGNLGWSPRYYTPVGRIWAGRAEIPTVMRLTKKVSVLSVLACSLLAAPGWANPAGADVAGAEVLPRLPLLASADSEAIAAKKDEKTIGVPPAQVTGNVADLRLASQWMAAAYRIPARVPEEMLLAGHSYGDVLVALALMDYGASLNELLEQRQDKRWPAVAEAVGVGVNDLPAVIKAVMVRKYSDVKPPLLRFFPDVRSGLSERLRIPSCSPAIPDSVAVVQFRMTEDDVRNVRAVLAHPNDATPEMLMKPAGRSLVAADWLIAATLTKYNPNPLETLLMMRTGEVVEWGDIASTFSIDPRVFTSGPLAPIYGVLTGTYVNTVVPSLARPYYPSAVSDLYNLDTLRDEQREALRWLMSLYYRENSAEKQLLTQQGFGLRDEAMCLAVSRLSLQPLETIIQEHIAGVSWASMVTKYGLDLTGEDVFKAVVGLPNAQ